MATVATVAEPPPVASTSGSTAGLTSKADMNARRRQRVVAEIVEVRNPKKGRRRGVERGADSPTSCCT